MSKVRIGSRWIGEGEPCYVIAEAGSNHNGNFEHALRLIEVAADAGADAVKFQNFTASKLYPRSAGESDYLGMHKPIYDIIHQMEMPSDWVPRIAAHCRERCVDFISSAFDEEAVDLLDPHVSAFKVASYEMTHGPLIRHVAAKGKLMIVSTGTASLEEVRHAVDVMQSAGNNQAVLLQCTASYPTPMDAANLRAIQTLHEATGLPAGLSDHTRDAVIAPVAAVALGASVIEKHFTLSNRLPGPDHTFAVEPHELARMVQAVRDAERALGHGRKEMLPIEAELHAFARRSVFAIRDITAGEPFTGENIAVLRRGKIEAGLDPEAYPELLRKTAARIVRTETSIVREDVAW